MVSWVVCLPRVYTRVFSSACDNTKQFVGVSHCRAHPKEHHLQQTKKLSGQTFVHVVLSCDCPLCVPSCVCVHVCVLSYMCSFIPLASYVCCHCVFSPVCSHVFVRSYLCSHMCALTRLLTYLRVMRYACSQMPILIFVLSCVFSHTNPFLGALSHVVLFGWFNIICALIGIRISMSVSHM